jgi:hypothetical protein
LFVKMADALKDLFAAVEDRDDGERPPKKTKSTGETNNSEAALTAMATAAATSTDTCREVTKTDATEETATGVAAAATAGVAVSREEIEKELWDYCDEMGKAERAIRKVTGVTLNKAVLTDPRFARAGREWRELDVGGFMDVNNEVKEWETGSDHRSHPDYPNTLHDLSEEDNSVDGYETGEEWIEEVKDKLCQATCDEWRRCGGH